MKKTLGYIVLVFLLILLASCGKSSLDDSIKDEEAAANEELEKLTEDGETVTDSQGEETTIEVKSADEEDISLTGESEGRKINVGTNVDIPDEFPADIPIPVDANVASALVLNEDSEQGEFASVRYLCECDYRGLVKLYRDYVYSGNFETVEDAETDEEIAKQVQGSVEEGYGLELFYAFKDDEKTLFRIHKYEDDDTVDVIIEVGTDF